MPQTADYRREYYKNNREKLLTYYRNYRKDHPEKYKLSQQKYKDSRPEQWKETQRKYDERRQKDKTIYNRNWLNSHPDKGHEYYMNHRESKLEHGRQWRKANHDKVRAYALEQRKRTKIKIISHYSDGKMACALCGIKELDCLSIDHINGGGHKHSKLLKQEGTTLYQWLINNNFPEGYQVLCMNCQFIKRAKQLRERRV